MSIEDKLREALQAYKLIEPASDARRRLDAQMLAPSRAIPVGRAVFVAFAAILALGSILAVRLISDRPSGLKVISPGPTIGPTLAPTPTPSLQTSTPSPSPSPSPTGDKVQYVSPDGVWELQYPKEWFGPGVAPAGDFTNYKNSPKEVPLPIKVDLLSYGTEPNRTLDDLLAEMCAENPYVQIFECKKVEINGRTWAWVRAYAEADDDPAMALDVRTIVDGKVYAAIGYVFGKSGHDPAIEQIREVLVSLVLNV